jgi:hypothetical protein
MKGSLQVLLVVVGIAAITIASVHVIFGPSLAIPGSVPVNTTMDSEDRFYATLFAAYGAALLWCVKGVERKSRAVHFLAITFFAGGLARLVSMATVRRRRGGRRRGPREIVSTIARHPSGTSRNAVGKNAKEASDLARATSRVFGRGRPLTTSMARTEFGRMRGPIRFRAFLCAPTRCWVALCLSRARRGA